MNVFAEPLVTPLQRGAGGYREWARIKDPAAAADWIYTVEGRLAHVVAVTFTFATSAVVNSRSVDMYFEDGNGIPIHACTSGQLTVASTTRVFSFFPGCVTVASGADPRIFQAPLPAEIIMAPGHVIRSRISGLSAGDQASRIYLTLDRYPVNSPGRPQPRRRARR